MVIATAKPLTVADYLEQEEKARDKSEFIQGEIIPMAGASANHNRLTINLSRLLPLEVRGCEYEIFVSDMQLWIEEIYQRVKFFPD